MRQRGRSALGKTVAAENRTFLLPAALQLPHPSRLFSTSPQSKSRPANTSQALPSARQGRTAPFLALLSGQSLVPACVLASIRGSQSLHHRHITSSLITHHGGRFIAIVLPHGQYGCCHHSRCIQGVLRAPGGSRTVQPRNGG